MTKSREFSCSSFLFEKATLKRIFNEVYLTSITERSKLKKKIVVRTFFGEVLPSQVYIYLPSCCMGGEKNKALY